MQKKNWRFYKMINFEMKVITDGTEQLVDILANDTPSWPNSNKLANRVAKLAKLQPGPIKVIMKEVHTAQQHQ